MITSLLGTVRGGGKVHEAHNATDRFAEDRITYCTDNNTSEFQRAITTVLGPVHDGGPEALLATLHGLEIRPARLCAVCFFPQWRTAYRAQWDSRTRSNSPNSDAMVITTDYPAYVTDLFITATDLCEGVTVRIGGSNPDLFPDIANAAARAVVYRLGWEGARVTARAMRADNQLGSFGYERADTFVGLIKPDAVRVRPPVRRPASLGYDPGSPERRGPIATSGEGTVTITWGDESLVGIDIRAGTVMVWPDGENAHVVARFGPAVARDRQHGVP